MNIATGSGEDKPDMRVNTHADLFLRPTVTFLVLAFPAACIFLNRGDSYTLGLLTLIGLWVWLRTGIRIWINRDVAKLFLTFMLLFLVVLLTYFTGYKTVDGFHFLGRYLRFLFVVPAYLALRRYPPTAKTAFIGLAFGALTAGVMATLEFLHAHGPIRVEAQTDLSIIFGDLTTTMVLCTVAGFGLMAASRRSWSVPLLILCLAGGIAASLLSGTRGAWIPLLLLPLALMTPLSGFLKHRYVFAIMLVFVAVFSSFYFVLRSDTQARLMDVGKNIRNYFIALHYFDDPVRGTAGAPACVDSKTFLHAWMRAGRSITPATTHTLETEVVADPSIGIKDGCRADYAVRLHNGNRTAISQYILPRLPGPRGNVQHSQLLVRGVGTLAFLSGKTASSFTSQAYETVSMNDKKTPDQVIQVYIKVTIPPGNTVWLVPLDGYFGEYSLSIANTSVGVRFELWRSAWRQFLQHPLLGAGTGAFQAKTLQFIGAGIIAPFANIYDHPHNDYLDALASHGIVGLVVLLAVFLVPAGFFMQAIRRPERVRHAVGLAGVLTVAGFATYALTDTIFLHSMMITWYVIYMAMFYTLLDIPVKSGPDDKSMQ